MSSSQSKTRGYVVVGSRHYRYYSFACNVVESIKDYHPEAKVCLVTEERFLDQRADLADDLLLCGNGVREKLWGMANTPYDLTFYIDADSEVIHEDIAKVWDELGDHDMMFTGLPRDRWYVFKDTEFPGGTFTLCGAVCLYDSSNPLVMEFMKDWHEYFIKQNKNQWWPTNEQGEPDDELYPRENLSMWDQFTLWWLTEKEPKYKDLKVGIFENDLRWNYWAILDRTKQPMPENTVVYHLSCQAKKFDQEDDNP